MLHKIFWGYLTAMNNPLKLHGIAQFYHSRLLNTVGEKEQNQFYYKMMQKIDALCDLIKAQDLLGFE